MLTTGSAGLHDCVNRLAGFATGIASEVGCLSMSTQVCIQQDDIKHAMMSFDHCANQWGVVYC